MEYSFSEHKLNIEKHNKLLTYAILIEYSHFSENNKIVQIYKYLRVI